MTQRRKTFLVLFTAALLTAAPGWPSARAGDDPATLHRMRAERRAASRSYNTGDKSAHSGMFGLLVIPVDFADARLPADWDPTSISPRLTSESGESLRHYFTVASGGRLDLRVTLAPLVRLPGTRRDYSDRDLQGFTRTRRLATESLEAVRDLGLEFRRLDMDGPDGIAGTDDDDGELDGILILHAAPGEENDPVDGLIQPLQFYLDEPVLSDGIAATFYAVASLQSGPGIWAHETAHLLGLEDRYDPLLPSAGGEVSSRGGLGRFSLMSSGAWGTGDGWGAALPDAYSRVQMGWIPVVNLPPSSTVPDTLVPGEARRAWTSSAVGPEFFMMETRDPIAAAPFDAAVPAGDMIIYHVDETVPESGWSDDGPGAYHLRVRVVEADDDGALQDGLEDGRAEDLFPGPLGVDSFTPSSIPASDGYQGPTTVNLTDIHGAGNGVVFLGWTDPLPGFIPQYGFETIQDSLTGEAVVRLHVTACETGTPLPNLIATVTIEGNPAWGSFEDTDRYANLVFQRNQDGCWTTDRFPRWLAEPEVPPGSTTDFIFRFHAGDVHSPDIPWTWVWGLDQGVLDFANDWPGEWVVDHPDGDAGTTWFRWDRQPFLTADGTPVLACVDAAYPTSDAWPSVTYGNGAHTTLTSGPLGDGVAAVRMVHAIETEMLAADEAADGGRLVWVDEAGTELPALPVDDYPGMIATRVRNPLHGQPAFVQDPLELEGDIPLWRTDVVPVPDEGGPWRLRFVFASNSLWRYRGWFIASLVALDVVPESAFAVAWNGDLAWEWPFGTGDREFEVSYRSEDRAEWNRLWSGTLAPDPGTGAYVLDGGIVLAGLPGSPRDRHRVRVVGTAVAGPVASRGVTVYEDGGDGATILLSQPWPNPGRAPIRFQIDVPVASTAKVSIFDLRGRLLRRLEYPAGSHLGIWDGKDSRGRLASSGAYFLRLEGSGPVTTRKVVLLH